MASVPPIAKTVGGLLIMRKRSNILETETASNGGATIIQTALPYTIQVELCGSCDLLFHRWNDDSVAAKAAAAKGSKAKKTDDIESYVYRNEDGYISIPGEYLRSSIVGAAKFRQDPRSPRKSAQDLFKAGVTSLTDLASLGSKDWDYLYRRRVIIQRSAITRIRPAFKIGWTAKFQLMVSISEYISEEMLREMVGLAGRLIGVGDFRPTFGRFDIISWKRLS